ADGAMAALGSGGPILAYADPAAGGGLAYRDGQRPAQAIDQVFGAPLQSSDLTFWAQGVGAWGRVNSDGNAADLSRNLGGIFTGFDGRLASGAPAWSAATPMRRAGEFSPYRYRVFCGVWGRELWGVELPLGRGRWGAPDWHQPLNYFPRLLRAGERALQRHIGPSVR